MQKESWVALVIALAAPVLLVAVLRLSFDTPEVLDDPQDAYHALGRKEYAKAEEICREQLKVAPGSPALLAAAGRAAAALNEPERVEEYFRAMPKSLDNPDSAIVSGFADGAEELLEFGHLELSEELLRWANDLDAWNFETHRKLARVLRATGRWREAHEHFVLSMRGKPAKLVDLLTACSPDVRVQQIEALLQHAATVDANPTAVQLGLGMMAYQEGRWEEAESHFRRSSGGGPAAPLAAAMIGLIIVERDRWDELQAWYESLPEDALDEPEAWYVEGRWANHRGEPRAAIRCFAEAVRRDPMGLEANEQLAATLRSQDLNELAEPFRQQAANLAELRACVAKLPVPQPDVDLAEQPNPTVLKRIVELLDELGREWEAGAWAQYADTLQPPIEWASPEVSRIADNLSGDSPAILPDKKPIRGFQLTDFPLPTWSRHR